MQPTNHLDYSSSSNIGILPVQTDNRNPTTSRSSNLLIALHGLIALYRTMQISTFIKSESQVTSKNPGKIHKLADSNYRDLRRFTP